MIDRMRAVALMLGLVTVTVAFSGCVLSPEGNVTLKEATEIVIEKFGEPSEAAHGLRVYKHPKKLPEGSKVVPYLQWTTGEKDFLLCSGDCWFFWLDDDPLAQFAHKTRFVLVDVSTGETIVKEGEWWPVVNGEVMWETTDERASDEFLVYEKPFELELPSDWKHDLELEILPLDCPGCEAWAILVCGSADQANTFDEDVQYMYNVLTELGYPDDHIFYISPWTTDPGVDRDTTIANVAWAIGRVAANSDADDKVFLFYSSHGSVDGINCQPGAPGGGIILSAQMDNWLDTITAGHMIIMLQGCHTGSFIGAYSDGTVVASENELTGDGETNRIAITATDTTHSSYGGPSSWGSTFAGGYIAAFSEAATADVDGNGAISVNEAYTYACDHDSYALAGASFPQMDPTSLDPADVFHTCVCPDLVIDSLSHSPDSPTTVDQIVFTVVVKNIGAGRAGPSTLSIRVGGETTPETFPVPSLDPGASHTVQRQEALTIARRYGVTAIADAGSDLVELDEGNNQESITLTVSQPIP